MSKQSLATLPLEWVRAFEAAGRMGSFVAAAAEIGVTQAAISQRIGHLEARIGTRLFLRKPRGVALTVEGQAWLPHISAALTRVQQSADDLFGTFHRCVTISASASVIQHWLAPRLVALQPADRLEISFSTMVLQEDYQNQKAAVEIRYLAEAPPGQYAAKLFEEALSPVAASGTDTKDWQNARRIGLSGPRQGWTDWARAHDNPTSPAPHLRFDSHAAALAATKAGAGVLLASLPLCTAELRAGTIVRLSPHSLYPQHSYWMLADKSRLTDGQWKVLNRLFCAG